MKTEVKKISNLKREIKIHVPKETIEKKMDEVYKKINHKAKVPGFRAGHVPREILERHYLKDAQEELLREIIPQSYDEALKTEKIIASNYPEIQDVKLENDQLKFTALVEIMPEIKFNSSYKGLKAKKEKAEVGESEVSLALDTLKQKKSVSSLDDKFAKSLGFKTLDELKDTLKTQILMNKETQTHKALEGKIIEQLLGITSFDVPEGLEKRNLEEMLKDYKQRLIWQGAKKEDVEAKDKELRESMKEAAKTDLKVYLILNEIAKLENIKFDKEENMHVKVIEFLLQEADWQ